MRRRYRRKKYGGIRFMIIIAAVSVLLFYTDSDIRPYVRQSAEKSASSQVGIIINDTVSNALKNGEYTYNQLVHVSYDENNCVKSVECDTIKLNIFMSQLNSEITKAVSEYDKGNIKINTGTLLGNDYLMGRGPDITVKYSMICKATSKLESKFFSTGINQTKHQLTMHVTADIRVLIPWYSTDATVETEIPIDEMIIVGDVPQSLTDIDLSGGTLNNTDNGE